MENQIVLSIIIPIYNVEKYLKRCINSIVKQCDEQLEIILVDDGSPDQCPLICDDYARRYANIKVVHKKNGGLASAIKEGTLIATGRHIAYIDSDDWFEPGWYNAVKKILYSYPNIDTIMYGFQRIEDGQKKVTKPYARFEEGYYKGKELYEIKKSYMKAGGIGPTRWNKVYRRDIAMECLKYYDIRISIGEDMVFSAIATDLMQDTYILKKCFVNYYINDGSMTQHFNQKYEASFEVLFEALATYFKDASVLYYIHYINMRTMVNALSKSDYDNKRKYLKRLLKNNSSRLRNVMKQDLTLADKIFIKIMIMRFPSVLLFIAKTYCLFQ